MQEIIDKIGIPAMLEQTAEECAELSQACLKLSRKFRGENPTPVDMLVLLDHLSEEIADVQLCTDTILESGVVNTNLVDAVYKQKIDRWKNRLSENKKED